MAVVSAVERGRAWENEWEEKLKNYKSKYPQLATQFDQYLKQDLPDGWDKGLPVYKAGDQ